tara:strand:- start:108 stop:299 length:192 start_codon:yes stop_codon:yes gene_type:complete
MSLDDDFFLCWFVVKENLFLLDFGSPFFFYLKKSKRFLHFILKKKTQAHQTLRFFSILNTSRQ